MVFEVAGSDSFLGLLVRVEDGRVAGLVGGGSGVGFAALIAFAFVVGVEIVI